MSLKSKFLTLPIKNQICIVIIALNIFCILSILSIFGSLAYQILKEDINQKRLYFYEKYKEYIESCFYFQNFCLLQYEELIKRIQLQIKELLKVGVIYNYTYNINMHIMDKFKTIEFNQDYLIDNFEQEEDNDFLYYNCFDEEDVCLLIKNDVMLQYNALSSLVSSHNINKKFNMPMVDNIALMDDPVFYESFSFSIFSFNLIKLLKYFKEIFGDENNILLLYNYLYIKIRNFFDGLIENIDFILVNPPPLIDLFYNKTINNNKQELLDYLDLYKKGNTAGLVKLSSLFPKIDYGNNKINLIYEDDILLISFYIESNLIDNYLYFMNNKLSSFIDLYFIPLYYENNTIISPDLSILFLIKQVGFQITQKEVDKLYEIIIKGKSNIQDCIKDFEFFENKLELNDIFGLNHNFFIFVSNSSINQGILKLENSYYYFMKYSYPNFNTLIDFKPEFFYRDQINFYAFSSLKNLLKYTNLLLQITSNCFNLFILIIVYIWLFCFLVNIIIFNKVNKQLLEPIKKLQETLLSDSIKDAKLFEYEYDEIINELFLTCKEFLSGKIDKANKEKELDNLNNLSISKEKSNKEENKYNKNLKINNYLMNKLIKEQNFLMDFSKYIETNENNILENNENENSNNSLLYIKKMNDNNKLENNIKNKISFKFQKEDKEKENREYFKTLFKISEYFHLFLNENKQKYISIKDNEINDESKKTEKSYQIYSEQEISNDKTIIKKTDYKLLNNDNSKSFSINIINKNDMTYLWYMEAKKRNNKSLNYKIGKNYDELFNDVNIFENYN